MGWNRGKEWKIREKLHYSFWAPLFCFLKWAKYKKQVLKENKPRESFSFASSPKMRKCSPLTRLTYVRARAFQQRCWFFAVTSVTLSLSSSSCIGLLLALSPHHYFRLDIDQQTTRCFQQNDTLFFIKRHVALHQTSRLSPFYLNTYSTHL